MDILFQTVDVIGIWLALPWFFQWTIIGLAGIAALHIVWHMLGNLTLTISMAFFAFALGYFLMEAGIV